MGEFWCFGQSRRQGQRMTGQPRGGAKNLFLHCRKSSPMIEVPITHQLTPLYLTKFRDEPYTHMSHNDIMLQADKEFWLGFGLG